MLRVLLLADTHLGFDLPVRPRVVRRRRGHDFLANYERALAPAREGRVDLVVHGGDVFHRPRVAPDLARLALRPLLEVADLGVPVFVVPGNHERARLPASFRRHAGVRVFDGPRTFVTEAGGVRVALSGFPYVRRSVRTAFPDVLRSTGWQVVEADVRLLCVHHCVEGATVGPGDFTFTSASDVIRCRDLPSSFAAVLSGHIHRRQVLTADLRGRPLRTPVLYPGSVERTSLAERDEAKGYILVEIDDGVVRWKLEPLPARPMIVRRLSLGGVAPAEAESMLRAAIRSAPSDAVLRIDVTGDLSPATRRVLAAARIRSMTPATMNVELSGPDRLRPPSRPSEPDRRGTAQLDLGILTGT